MKQSQAFHKGIRRVWSRLSAVSGTSRLDTTSCRFLSSLYSDIKLVVLNAEVLCLCKQKNAIYIATSLYWLS